MADLSNIQSLHGRYFAATICFDEVVGRISVNEAGSVFLCQNSYGITSSSFCRDFLGYEFVWGVELNSLTACHVFNLKILPPPTEYHALFQEILAKRGPAWDVDGAYSVIPKEVMASIADFMSKIKAFEPKNPSK